MRSTANGRCARRFARPRATISSSSKPTSPPCWPRSRCSLTSRPRGGVCLRLRAWSAWEPLRGTTLVGLPGAQHLSGGPPQLAGHPPSAPPGTSLPRAGSDHPPGASSHYQFASQRPAAPPAGAGARALGD